MDTPDRWHLRFLELASLVASWSKDPSTKTGAVLVRPDRTIAAVGYNGFPRGMDDDPSLYAVREVKYSRVVHCEMNALLNCKDQGVAGFTLYTVPGPSCDRCAVHMIQAGIRRFVFPEPTIEQFKRWNVASSLAYFAEVGAEVVQVPRLAMSPGNT